MLSPDKAGHEVDDDEHGAAPRLFPGGRARPSLSGARPAAAAMSWRASRTRNVPHGIVPHDALTTGAADHAVVAQDITVLATARAGAWLVIHWKAQPKLAGNN